MTSTIDEFNKSQEVYKKVAQIKKGYVTIGFDEDAGMYPSGVPIVKVALWNEFGTDTSPERSFFRTAIDENADKLNQWREEMFVNVIYKNWSVEKALNQIGLRVKALIQYKIKSNVPPPNKPSTLAKKHGSITLNDTKLMLNSVSFKVHL